MTSASSSSLSGKSASLLRDTLSILSDELGGHFDGMSVTSSFLYIDRNDESSIDDPLSELNQALKELVPSAEDDTIGQWTMEDEEEEEVQTTSSCELCVEWGGARSTVQPHSVQLYVCHMHAMHTMSLAIPTILCVMCRRHGVNCAYIGHTYSGLLKT